MPSAIIYCMHESGHIVPTCVYNDEASTIVMESLFNERTAAIRAEFHETKTETYEKNAIRRQTGVFINDSELLAFQRYCNGSSLDDQIITTAFRRQALKTRIYQIPEGPLILENIMDSDPYQDEDFTRDYLLFSAGYARVDVFKVKTKYLLVRVFAEISANDIAMFFSFNEQQLFMCEIQFREPFVHKCHKLTKGDELFWCIVTNNKGQMPTSGGLRAYNIGEFMIRYNVGNYDIMPYEEFIKDFRLI